MIVERIKKIVEKYKNKIIIIRGGWNARIGEEGGNDEVNNEGEEILKLIGEIGGNILKGVIDGNKEGEFTYVGPRSSSVIDYVVVNDGYDIVNSFKVADRVDSDYLLVIMTTKGGAAGITGDVEKEEAVTGKIKSKIMTCWSMDDIRLYKERTEHRPMEENGFGNSIENMWNSLKSFVIKSMIKKKYKKARKK